MFDLNKIKPSLIEGHLLDLAIELNKITLSLSGINRLADKAVMEDPEEQTEALLEIEALAAVVSAFSGALGAELEPAKFMSWAKRAMEGLNDE